MSATSMEKEGEGETPCNAKRWTYFDRHGHVILAVPLRAKENIHADNMHDFSRSSFRGSE